MVELGLGAVLELHRYRLSLALLDDRATCAPGLAAVIVVLLGRRVGRRERSRHRIVVAVAETLGGLGVELPQRLQERPLGVRERDPILRALRPGDAGLDIAEVELESLRERRVLGVLAMERALLARVGIDQLDQVGGPPGELEVAERLPVHREDRARGTELR